ncbi:Hypothetical_protein [Hexamita inflata]|uniref:Hypothetical_protein n=1 Tax=Hexamita inflata TaxID=28002 RepID=A0AA86UIM9_9EUKA|nr:Hypothetical protein HINF_LOCUS40337 [Hexamita inflata]
MSTLGTLSQWSSSLQKALPVAQRANSRETADRNLRILIDSSSSKKTVCFFGLDSLSLNQPMNLSICDGVSILERMKSSCSQLYALSRANLSVFEQKRLSVYYYYYYYYYVDIILQTLEDSTHPKTRLKYSVTQCLQNQTINEK